MTTWLEKGKIPASFMRLLGRLFAMDYDPHLDRVKRKNCENLADWERQLLQGYDFDSEVEWIVPWQILNLPIAFHWTYDHTPPVDDPVPREVKNQLIGQKIATGIQFQYGGLDCYVVSIALSTSDLGKVITAEHMTELQFLAAVETRFIDMDA